VVYYRTTFTTAANIIVFACFWILLEKINHDTNISNLTPDDKEVFWVGTLCYNLSNHLIC